MQVVSDFVNKTEKKDSQRDNFSNIESINVIVKMFESARLALQFDFFKYLLCIEGV